MGENIKYTQGFEIEMTKAVEERIRWLTSNYEKEISAWLGGELKENKIIIDDILFPEQEVSGGSVDTDGKQLIKLRKEYGDRCKRIIGHWHSHNSIGAFWSATNEEFIEQHMQGRNLRLFIVSSSQGDSKVRLELGSPIRLGLDNLKIKVDYQNPKIEEEMKKVIEDKVIESKPVTNYVNYGEDEEFGEVKLIKSDWDVEWIDVL